ncbi:hypothetical protein ACFX15_038752 [Malus domestica]
MLTSIETRQEQMTAVRKEKLLAMVCTPTPHTRTGSNGMTPFRSTPGPSPVSPPPHTPSNTVVSPTLSIQSSELPENPIGLSPPAPATTCLTTKAISTTATATTSTGNCNNGSSVFAPSSASALMTQPPQASSPSSFTNQVSTLGTLDGSTTTSAINEPTSLSPSPSAHQQTAAA